MQKKINTVDIQTGRQEEIYIQYIQTSREAGKDIYSVYTDSQTGRTRCINLLYRQAVRQADKQRQAGRQAKKKAVRHAG